MSEPISLLVSLPAAFVGGLILNVMPCVLPVLTMKVFHLLDQSAREVPQRVHRIHGLAYLGGVLVTFLAFGAMLAFLRASGELVGWGMHFQDPRFVAAMIAIMVLFGLNALGVFEFSLSVQSGEQREGYAGSFANGVIASIMSTPCSAPFLGTAALAALGAGVPAWQTLTLFAFIGLGLAFPFVLVSFVPALGRLLPRPGAWMETFKHLMGFSLLAAAVWLSASLLRQVTPESFHRFLILLLLIGFSAWAWGRWGGLDASTLRRRLTRVAALVVVGTWGVSGLSLEKASIVRAVFSDEAVIDGRINWQPFSPEAVGAFHAQNRPVFMDYTADWCQNCKANEALFIETDRIRQILSETGVVPMKADMTNEDPEILRWLTDLGRTGIPAYAIYMPDGSHDLLPVTITTDLLAERMQAAAAAFPARGER